MDGGTAGHPKREVIRMSHQSAYFNLDRVDGNHDVKALKKGLDELTGVTSVSINRRSGQLAVDYDSTGVDHAQIQRRIEELGFPVGGLNIDQLTD